MNGLAGIDVAILAGGLGTRIRAVLGDVPKLLAPVRGRPFLDHLAERLGRLGGGRLVLCLGHLADRVCSHLDANPPSLPVVRVIESEPLGTGGALRFARPALASEPVMVMNGDSWTDADLAAFLSAHRARRAFISILCVSVPDISRFGGVEVGADATVRRFAEKEPGRSGPGLINAGVYLFSQAALDELVVAPGPSLERDFLQRQPPGRIHAFVQADAAFIDIGTPESLGAAGTVIGEVRRV